MATQHHLLVEPNTGELSSPALSAEEIHQHLDMLRIFSSDATISS